MKKFLLLLAFLPLMASAQTLIDGIYYNLISKMKQAEVTNVSGNYYSGDVEIPSTVTYEDVEYTVTSIKASAFLWCENLKSVTIPNTVKTIGESAFYKCTSLNSVKLGTGVTSIGEDAFNGDLKIRTVSIYDFEAWCKIEFKSKASNPMLYGDFLYLNDMQVKAPKIPDSVTSIGDFAFIGCSHFVSVTIPNTVTNIGRYAFESCDSLTSISIPGSVETIGDFAFNECKKVTSLTISDGVKSIGKYAFGSCEGVTSLSIPNSVKSIGDDAFAGCNGITSVTFGNGLSSIGDYAFLECVGMSSAIIPEGVTRIGEGAFKGCSAISKLSLPSSLKELDPLAFAECPNLTNVYCYAEELPYTKRNALNWETPYITDLFKDSYIEYATLYVPETAIDAYKEIETWNGFGTILAIGDEPVTGITINETNFPDENFRNWILSQEYGQDGILTDEEIASITGISIPGMDIQNLQGIEFFTALTMLECNSNQLTTLDLSKNIALIRLVCNDNQLTSLDVSKNTTLRTLDCNWNQLTTLDLSANTALIYLQCYNNQLTSLDVSWNTKMIQLWCSDNQLTSLAVPKEAPLAYIGCYGNQLNGEAMDAIVENLPVVNNISLQVKRNDDDEGNEMTVSQVAAAKEKGWIPQYFDGTSWQDYEGSEPEVKKCATPTIINLNGKLMFYCETEDVKYDYSIVLSVEGSDQNITLPKSCKISVIATKEGYEPSDPFMIEVDMSYLIGKLGDVNKDGVVNGTDIQEIINIIISN
jgi:hypothetical protein